MDVPGGRPMLNAFGRCGPRAPNAGVAVSSEAQDRADFSSLCRELASFMFIGARKLWPNFRLTHDFVDGHHGRS